MGMSQRAIAAAMNVSQSTVSRTLRAARSRESVGSPERLAQHAITGLDGKTYVSMSPELKQWIVGRVHHLAHDEHLSIRQIVKTLDERHNVRVSVGAAHGYLRSWRCLGCSPESFDSPGR
jgi:IS30 family transposase